MMKRGVTNVKNRHCCYEEGRPNLAIRFSRCPRTRYHQHKNDLERRYIDQKESIEYG
jgi:hypothetical protein